MFAVLRAAAVAFGALALGAPSADAVLRPDVDPFYAAPANLAAIPPGEIIRSRSVRMSAFPGLTYPNRAYQVLYRSNDAAAQPVAVAATVLLPARAAHGVPKLVSYQTAYDGLAASCQPSYTLQTGRVILQGAETFLIASFLHRGWAVVTADYEGPQNAYMVGPMAAHGVLDGIRAAQRLPGAHLDLATTKVGLTGYSGGGYATAWASEQAANYAPELNIVGVAHGGLAVDLAKTFKRLDGELIAGVVIAAIAGLTHGYPQVDFHRYLNARGRRVFRDIVQRTPCITDYILAHPFLKLRSLLTIPDPLVEPRFREVLDANALGQAPPRAPTFIYQAVFDEMENFPDVVQLAKQYCRQGAVVRFSPGWFEEHGLAILTVAPKALSWLAARFRGETPVDNCPR